MEIIALLLMVYFLIGACICLLICVNPNDPGFMGSLNRFFFKKLPSVFRYPLHHVATSFAEFLDKQSSIV